MRRHVGREVREVGRVELLRAVAEGQLRVLRHLDDDAVGAHRGGGARQRAHQPPVARGVRGIDDHRQVRVQLQPRHRAEVEREAHGAVERADPALAEDHALVALLEDVVGGLEQLVEGRGEAALQQHRLAELADDLEQPVVLHVARSDLDDVNGIGEGVGQVGEVISLTIGRPVSSRAARKISSPSVPSPWNEKGEVRGLNAPPRSIDAPAAATAWAMPSVWARATRPCTVRQ